MSFPYRTPNYIGTSSGGTPSLKIEPPTESTQQAPIIFNSHSTSNIFQNGSENSQQYCSKFARQMQPHNVNVSRLDPNISDTMLVPQSENIPESSVVDESRMPQSTYHSSELVCLGQPTPDLKRHYRPIVRKTRLTYNSLLNMCIIEYVDNQAQQEKRIHFRGDLIAGSIMRGRDLWLHREFHFVGYIPGVEVGDIFMYRMELCVVALHRCLRSRVDYIQASQSPIREPIATSVIISSGYEGDGDQGNVVIYIGQDRVRRCGVNQELRGRNLALKRSMHYGTEVRLIRKIKYDGSVSNKVYVYDGLYRVEDCWFDMDMSGFRVYKFRLVRIVGQPEMGSTIMKLAQAIRRSPMNLRQTGHFCYDISKGRESVPAHLFNNIDNDNSPMQYEYTVRTLFSPVVVEQGGNGIGCDCEGVCLEGCQCLVRNGGQFPYANNGMLLKGKPLIFECGLNCRCTPTCRNRVTQRRLKYRLEVFKSTETGWGVRSLDLIPAGSFICEYAGIALKREEATVLSMNGDSLIYPSMFNNTWTEWGNLSLIDSDYEPPSYPTVPPLDFAIDVSMKRNVAFYIRNTSTPNIFIQLVLYDHNNLYFPRVMLFAMESIPPLRELSIDYGIPVESGNS